MNRTVFNKRFFNLDMVNISTKKKNSLLVKNVIVYVNSALFLTVKKYSLQMCLLYEIEGIVEQAWSFIKNKKYREAESLLDKVLTINSYSNRAYFGKFAVCLLQDKDAYQYLKLAIETKTVNTYDDYYRIYLMLYNVLLGLDDDYIPLLELLQPQKKVIAFSRGSYNGKYLEFINLLNGEEYEKSLKALDRCLDMKQDFGLILVKKILQLVTKKQIELKKASAKQEQELEKQRSILFAQAIKNKDLVGAKKALESILNFRNKEQKDNYIYYLFLELIETIELTQSDVTFELMPVKYSYTCPHDHFYTFFEAVEAGDFAVALETGKKCRGKLLDTKQKTIKINLYVILLEMLFEKLELRKDSIDNLYLILIGNIEKGNYKHALNIYNDNSAAFKEYNGRLIKYLFERLMCNPLTDEKLVLEYDVEEDKTLRDVIVLDEESQEEIVEEVSPSIKIDDEEEELNEQVEYHQNTPVTIFLRHNEPNHEYFHKYQVCMVHKRFEDAKMWLDLFYDFLRQNGVIKRLDYYYYQINLGILETSYPEDIVYQRKQMYFLAYNAILERKYEEALTYLNHYIAFDKDRDVRGYLLLGRLYTLMKKHNNAIETYIKANAIAPSPDAYYFLGELYYKKHCWADAIFCYLIYNEFYPHENPTVYLNLSECYKHLNRADKVVKYLKIADAVNIKQNHGLYLKDRILKAEMIDKRKRENLGINQENSSSLINALE